MSEIKYKLTVGSNDKAHAAQLAKDLEADLLDEVSDLAVQRHPESTETMDFGATLAVILGAPSVVVLAHAIKKWLARNNSATLELRTPEGVLVASNLESRDVAQIIEAFGGAASPRARNAD